MIRRTPLKRSTKPLRRTPLKRSAKPIRRISSKRRVERAEYTRVRLDHLQRHPLCQLTVAFLRLDEAAVLRAFFASGGKTGMVHMGPGFANDEWCEAFRFNSWVIPLATQIHHRNKCQGARLTDARWFSSASPKMHQWVEDHKDEARRDGYLLPINADPDGFMPDGSCGLTTDEWLLVRAKNAVDGMG